MNEEYYKRIKDLLHSNDIKVQSVCSGGNFQCPVYLRESDSTTDICVLELSVRSENCLKRASLCTMEALITQIHGKEDLLKIRNCGLKSVREILEKMFLYQYYSLPESERRIYLTEVHRRSSGL